MQIEAAAVVREALSNAARHASASEVDIVVTVDEDLTVAIIDNGSGIGQPKRLSGIANAQTRQLLRGQLNVRPQPGGGTCFEWRVPLGSPHPRA